MDPPYKQKLKISGIGMLNLIILGMLLYIISTISGISFLGA